ncbi:E3 ubiquitin/ISG15 ligase TRIM25-like isoform X2 [Calonectris borealis]|uniref:E3 ubiquitin/ISG15 ligase TRIM25-like isoform X2 n=1 Tax=Calonectris borealis TaxID=1323832 RepID=UPI003F4C1DF0
MAKPAAAAGLEEDLTCSICLGIYSNPVSLSCGHSFCKECIQEARSHRQCCPLCYAQADPVMELQPNVQLQSIVQKFLDAPTHQEEEKCEVQCEEKGESLGQQGKVILCDFCLQKPQPAMKTCLNCEASLCQAHLSKHSTKSPLKDHVLVEPCDAQVLAERKCPQHSKLLECYCKTDSACICVLCCVTSCHKHHITTLEDAFRNAQSDFAETLKTVKKHEALLNQSIANLLKQEEEVKTKESQWRNQLESLFERMCLQLDNKKGEALKALSRNKEQQLSQIQMQIQKHKEEKDAASRDVQELEALRDQKDLLLFIKAFAAIQTRRFKPVPNKVGVELRTPPIVLDGSTPRTILRRFQKFLSDMPSLFEAVRVHEHLTSLVCRQGGFVYSDDIVSASSLSSFYCKVPNKYSVIPYVQSDQSFSEGSHFWEVDTSNARDWKLGIIHSSFECYLETSHGYLCTFLDQRVIREKHFPIGLKVVRVELDCGRNTLSFYNACVNTTDGPIETVTIPPKYPAHATFGVSGGSLRLL